MQARIDFIFTAKIRQLLKLKYKILFVFCIYIIGTLALILANFNYIDDIHRILYGTFAFSWWNRHTSTIMASILSLNTEYFLATFPYSLLISIFLLSISSIILLKIIDNKLLDSKIALIASASIGLSPYYLENLSYKFDAPFMALSVFASIFPFLFIKYKKIFILTSIISLLIMLTSYQASSGIYIIIATFLVFQKIIKNDKKEAFRIIIMFCISYLAVGILYLMIYKPEATYANTNIIPLKYLLIGLDKHITNYIYTIYSDWGGANRVYLHFIFGFALIFVVKSTLNAKINKIAALFFSIAIVIILFILSFGLYLIIVTPTFTPRSFIGFGVFIGILCIYSIYKGKILSNIITIMFMHFLIVFANYYGQSLKAQSDYQTFRFTIMLNDLGKFINTSHMEINSTFNINILGHSGVNPVIAKSKIHYPLIDRLIPNLQHEWDWSVAAFDNYGVSTKVNEVCKDATNKTMLIDTYFHTIESSTPKPNQTCFFITYKNITDYKSNF